MKKEYKLDGEPIGWKELIKYAVDNYGYDEDLKFTSEAARILRYHGHIVEENK